MSTRDATELTLDPQDPVPRAVEVPDGDRVRAHTAASQLHQIDAATRERVEAMVGEDESALTSRIGELEREWDMERTLQANAATLALIGVVLGVLRGRRWLLLPAMVMTFLLQHALQGWCPPLPLFRRLGVRTRREIDAEQHALKALRGDYDDLSAEAPSRR
jgi:hypothetical protein